MKARIRKHWSTRRGKVEILAVSLLSLTILFGAIDVFTILKGHILSQTTAAPMSQEALTATQTHLLTSDEFAIVTTATGKPSGQSVTHAINLSNGQTYTFAADKNTAVNYIDGSNTSNTYIKLSDNITIHKKDEVSSASFKKIDPAIHTKLKNQNDLAPVIVKLQALYGKFYVKGQSKDQAANKASAFTALRNKVAAQFSSNAHVKHDLHIINGFSADVDEQTLSQLELSPDVASVELDRTVSVLLDQSVPQIQANQVWELVSPNGQPMTGTGETIAIIDTGVDYLHPDLGGCLGSSCKVIGGYDFINNDADPMDDMGHGTHVAGIAAGKGLLNGVAPDAKILAVKVLNSVGSGTWSQVIAGIDYVANLNTDGNPADHVNVANMSLGGSGNPDDAVSVAVDNAVAAGVVFAVAAGNSGPSSATIMSPGTARTAITVAASCKTADIGVNGYCSSPIASFSSRGPLVWNGTDLQKPDIAAPGVSICSARWGNSFNTSPTCFDSQHVRLSGTSMATPHIAGAAALILEAYPNDTPDQVRQLLKNTAHNLGMTANDQGAGEVNVLAAIPLSQVAVATPNTWSVTSDPTKQLSTAAQTFFVTAKDSALTTLTPQYDNPVTGVSVTFSKTSLQVANLATDSFGATISVDNNTAKPGNYLTRIDLASNGVIKATIPVLITIKPTLTISPANTVDYGIDLPSLTSWTSNTQTYTLTNLRTDASQTVNITSTAFANGITFNTPASVTVPANGTASVNTSFTVTNANIADNIYTGTLTFTSPTVTQSVGTKFTKFYEVVVQDTANPSDLSHTFPLVLNMPGGKAYTDYSGNSPKIFYVTDPGPYDVIARFLYAPSKSGDNTVAKEGINVNNAITTIDVNAADATNLVQVNPITATGQPGQILNYDTKFVFGQNPMFETFGGGTSSQYFSTMSSNYGEQLLLTSFQPAANLYYYYYTFAGVNGSKTLTNAPGDFKLLYVPWSLDQQAGGILPVVFAGNGTTSNAVYYNNQMLPLPLTQTIYSLAPSTVKFYDWLYTNGGFLDTVLSPMFPIDNSLKRTTFYQSTLPTMTEPVVYQGLGPSVWTGRLQVSKAGLNINSDVWVAMLGFNLGMDTPAYLRQDYTTVPYDPQQYSLYYGSTLVSSGTLPGFGPDSVPRLGTIPLSRMGNYTFQTSFPYKDKGVALTAQVKEFFNSKNSSDPNPPALKRLYVYSNTVRSEVYDPQALNTVEFELDPVTGTMGTVTVSFSPDGTNFQPVNVTNTNGVYDAVLPQAASGTVSVKIAAKDSANNELDYTFQLPQGTAPVSVVSSTPSVPTATPTPTVALTPNPAPAIAFFTVQATNITANQALITWQTGSPTSSTTTVPGTTQVKYGLSPTSLTQTTPFDPTLTSWHSVTLTGLSARTQYYFQVLSNNMSGYPYASSVSSFTTKTK